jgi:hypothetical protein
VLPRDEIDRNRLYEAQQRFPWVARLIEKTNPLIMMTQIHIRWTATAQDAEELVAQGYCPVECAFGKRSVIDSLSMDHHGQLSDLEGVAIRAYRDHFGARRLDPRFVVTGSADADACFAIAALAGLLPHPSRADELASAPPPVKASGTRDLLGLAALVNEADLAIVRLEEMEGGDTLLLWKQLSSPEQDGLAFYSGVDRWRRLTGRPLRGLLEATKAEESARVNAARNAVVEEVGGYVAVVQSAVPGFDVWYAELRPLVVALTPSGNITLGCRDTQTAETLLGSSGFKRVYPLLGDGWGGREAVGGSPRGQQMTLDDARLVARTIADCVTQ